MTLIRLKSLVPLFEDADRLFNVKPDEYYINDTENLNDLVEMAIKKLENHSSVEAIKQNISVNQNLYFFNTMSVIYLKKLQL